MIAQIVFFSRKTDAQRKKNFAFRSAKIAQKFCEWKPDKENWVCRLSSCKAAVQVRIAKAGWSSSDIQMYNDCWWYWLITFLIFLVSLKFGFSFTFNGYSPHSGARFLCFIIQGGLIPWNFIPLLNLRNDFLISFKLLITS